MLLAAHHVAHPAPLDISIVVPTFNRACLVARALDSVRAQRQRPALVIVVDDASTDCTPEAVERWSRANDFPVEVLRLPTNVGPAAARNLGIAHAATRYVGFLDSDDEYLPDALAALVSAADGAPDSVLSFADATIVSPDGTLPHALFRPRIRLDGEATPCPGQPDVYRLTNATRSLLKASIIPTSATCFRRDAALRVGGMPEEFRAGEDWLFWLRLANQGSFVFRLDDVVLHHRHEGNLTHPDSAERTSREKLRGYLALERGSAGVRLSPDQRQVLAEHIERQTRTWRYNLSRLGLRSYADGIRSDVARAIGSPFRHVLEDPRAVLRAAYGSVSRSDASSRDRVH